MFIQFLQGRKAQQPIACFFFVTFFLASCSNNKSSPNTGTGNAKIYSGEQLFRGIMFATGELANQIPEIRKVQEFVGSAGLNPIQKAAVQSLQDSLVTTINKYDPDYFKTFQANIQSGDQVLIASTIRTASTLISDVLYERNKGLGQLLDNRINRLARSRLSNTEQVRKMMDLRDSVNSNTGYIQRAFTDWNRQLDFDRDVYINKITDININKNLDINIDRNLDINRFINTNTDVNTNLDFQRAIDRDFAINRTIDVFNFLDKNLNTHFDRVNINRSSDINFNPAADVTVDIETAIYAVVAVAVFVVAVAAWVVGRQDMFDDRGFIFKEQLVNSIAKNLNVNTANLNTVRQ